MVPFRRSILDLNASLLGLCRFPCCTFRRVYVVDEYRKLRTRRLGLKLPTEPDLRHLPPPSPTRTGNGHIWD